ncbi:unnamed protein product, partial [Ixodes hexagonus]
MTSSNHYSGRDYIEVAGQDLPPPNICDYVILDIRMNSTHGYDRLEYDFLRSMSKTSKFMFTIQQDLSVDVITELGSLVAILRDANFQSAARELYTYMSVRGFGILHYNHGSTRGDIIALLFFIESIYQVLQDVLPQVGYLDMTNFITIQLEGTIPADDERTFYTKMNGLAEFIVTETFVKDRGHCAVEAVSSFNGNCYFNAFSPQVKESLERMFTVQDPKSTFVLSLNLQALKFMGAFITSSQTTTDPKSQSCNGMKRKSFEQTCYDSAFKPSLLPRHRPFNNSDFCQFVEHPTYIYSYETDVSLEFKV